MKIEYKQAEKYMEKSKFLIVGIIAYEIVEAKNATEALAQYYTKNTNIENDIIIWKRDDLYKYLLKNNYNILEKTQHKEVFKLKTQY